MTAKRTIMGKRTVLEENNEWLNRTGAMALVGAWELDPELDHIQWTRTAMEIHGVDEGFRPVLKNILSLYNKESADDIRAALDLARKEGQAFDLESGLETKGGEGRRIRIVCEPAMEEGRCIRLSGIFQDITRFTPSGMRDDELLRSSERGMREAQRLANIGSWSWNLVTDELVLSDEMYRITGMDKSEAMLKVANHKAYYTPESWQRFLDAVETARNTGESYVIELELARPREQCRYTVARGEPILDDAGEVVGLRGTLQNITPQKRSEQELLSALDKAQESDRLKSAFLANMSHEIRTPMNGILGFIHLLGNPSVGEEGRREYTKIIHRSSERLLKTINNLIDISRIEAGQVQIVRSRISVNQLLEEAYAFFHPEAERKGLLIRKETSLPGENSFIDTDSEKLYAVLSNLINNAIKFTDSGTITIGYSPESAAQGPGLRFHVKDTGIGIPPERQEAIFNRFEQADIEDSKAYEGSGLGLSISRAYVEMLGGKIWVESEPGSGSRFFFSIPCVTGEEEAGLSGDIEPDTSGHENGKKLKILVADDDEISIFYLRTVLRELAGEIIHVENGIEAVERCRQDSGIDLILMDVKMPGMNGWDATRRIREFNRDVKIIAQTAYSLIGEREKALEAGCDDYLTKPLVEKILIEKITKLM